jgi:hypothetical protein
MERKTLRERGGWRICVCEREKESEREGRLSGREEREICIEPNLFSRSALAFRSYLANHIDEKGRLLTSRA